MVLFIFCETEIRQSSVDIVDPVKGNADPFDLLFSQFQFADPFDIVRVRIDDEPDACIRDRGKFFVRQVLFLGADLHIRSVISATLRNLYGIGPAEIVHVRQNVDRIFLYGVDIRLRRITDQAF